jgi:hypothetical protein
MVAPEDACNTSFYIGRFPRAMRFCGKMEPGRASRQRDVGSEWSHQTRTWHDKLLEQQEFEHGSRLPTSNANTDHLM